MAKVKKALMSYRVTTGEKKYNVLSRKAADKLLKMSQSGEIHRGGALIAIRKAGKTTWL